MSRQTGHPAIFFLLAFVKKGFYKNSFSPRFNTVKSASTTDVRECFERNSVGTISEAEAGGNI